MSVENVPFGDDSFELDLDGYATRDEAMQSPLPAPGLYSVKVTSMKVKKDKDGNPVVQEGPNGEQFKVYTINRIEILEPEGQGSHPVFQDVRSKPYGRPVGQRRIAASDTADILVAIDRTALNGLENFEEIASEFEQRVTSGADFEAYIGYTGYDKSAVDAKKAQLGQNPTPQELAEAYDAGRRNTKDFRVGSQVVTSIPSAVAGGRPVEAKLKLTSFTPSDKRGQKPLGPTQVKNA
jgi:hypothetical protein